jgi:heme O synthase-like polyprenyltransferase
MYRSDDARVGYNLLPVLDLNGATSNRQILVYSIALIPALVMAMMVRLTGALYFASALTRSIGLLVSGVSSYHVRTNTAGRKLLFASLFLLPTLFFLMML